MFKLTLRVKSHMLGAENQQPDHVLHVLNVLRRSLAHSNTGSRGFAVPRRSVQADRSSGHQVVGWGSSPIPFGVRNRDWWTVNRTLISLGFMIEGSLEVKLPTIWTGEKQRWEESGKRREEERRSKRERVRRKKIQVREKKGRKVAKQCVFPMICGSGGSKSRLDKAAGAEPAGQMRDEKLHAVVARSTLPSQKC